MRHVCERLCHSFLFRFQQNRYNLKRKVADMAPVTLEDFQTRMKKHEDQMKVNNRFLAMMTQLYCPFPVQVLSGEVKPPTGYCVSCRKSFNTEKAYENHLNSKKHKEIEVKFNKKKNKSVIANNRLNRKPSVAEDDDDDQDDMEVEEVDSDEWDEEFEGGDPLPVDACLFCSHVSKDWEKSLLHMMEKHSFFLPDAEFITDVEGLLQHLGEKVGVGFICLACDDRSRQFQSLSAVQKHMIDKGHCRIQSSGDAFLDYVK